jgi:hypothetical protein
LLLLFIVFPLRVLPPGCARLVFIVNIYIWNESNLLQNVADKNSASS